MSYNGSGTFNINSTGQPVVTGTVISSTAFNALTSDLATGLTTAITKDGQTTTTARIPFAQGVNSTLTTDATSSTTGSIITAGGISCQKALVIGTTLTYGGVTLTNAVTGTGKMVLDTSPTLTTAVVNPSAEGTVTAAATTDLSTSSANRQSVTGNTTITSFGTGANLYRVIRFTGTPLITYNATTLITPTGANIQAAPGDVATLSSDGSGNWRIISYQPYGGVVDSYASSVSVGNATATNITSISIPPGKWRVSMVVWYNSNNTNTAVRGGINSVSATFPTTYGKDINDGAISSQQQGSVVIPAYDVTPTTTTTYYLVAAVYGAGGSANCNGYIRAERIF